MKPLLCSFLLVIIITVTPSFALNYSVSAKLGLNTTSVVGDELTGYVNSLEYHKDLIFAFSGGAGFGLHINKYWSFHLETMYSIRGVEIRNGDYKSETLRKEWDYRFSMIDFPLYGKFTLPNKLPAKYSLYLGIAPSVYVSSLLSESREELDIPSRETKNSEEDISQYIQSFDLLPFAGFVAEFDLGKNRGKIVFDTRYSHSLKTIVKDENFTTAFGKMTKNLHDGTNRTLSLYAGYTFTFGNSDNGEDKEESQEEAAENEDEEDEEE